MYSYYIMTITYSCTSNINRSLPCNCVSEDVGSAQATISHGPSAIDHSHIIPETRLFSSSVHYNVRLIGEFHSTGGLVLWLVKSIWQF